MIIQRYIFKGRPATLEIEYCEEKDVFILRDGSASIFLNWTEAKTIEAFLHKERTEAEAQDKQENH